MMIFFNDIKNSKTLEKHTTVKNTTHDSNGITFRLYLGLSMKKADRPMLLTGSIA